MRGATVAITPTALFVLLPNKFANDLITQAASKGSLFYSLIENQAEIFQCLL